MLLAALLAAGCGGTARSPTPIPISPPAPVVPSVLAALPGDWLALATPTAGSTTLPTPINSFSCAITVSGTSIAGVFRVFEPEPPTGCPPSFTAIPFTGSLDAVNNLILTASFAGGVATITAALPQNLQTYTAGSFQVVGGTCSMPATPMRLAQFASATGTYAGTYNALDPLTLLPIPGTAIVITAMLVQAPTPSLDGAFALTGTVSSTGACTGKLQITEGNVPGGGVQAVPLNLTNPPLGEFSGALNPSATTLIGFFSLFTDCSSSLYRGTLTRQ